MWPGKSDVDQLHLIRCTLGQLSARHLAVFRNNQYFAGVTLPDLPSSQPTGLRAKLPQPVDEAALDLLRQSLHKEPLSRPTAEIMLRHHYFDRLSLPEALEREHRISERQSPPRYQQSGSTSMQASAASTSIKSKPIKPQMSSQHFQSQQQQQQQQTTAQPRRLNSLLPQLPNGSSSMLISSEVRNMPLHSRSHVKLSNSFDHNLNRTSRMEHLPNL